MIRKVVRGAVVVTGGVAMLYGAGWGIYGVMLAWEYVGALFLAAH